MQENICTSSSYKAKWVLQYDTYNMCVCVLTLEWPLVRWNPWVPWRTRRGRAPPLSGVVAGGTRDESPTQHPPLGQHHDCETSGEWDYNKYSLFSLHLSQRTTPIQNERLMDSFSLMQMAYVEWLTWCRAWGLGMTRASGREGSNRGCITFDYEEGETYLEKLHYLLYHRLHVSLAVSFLRQLCWSLE